MDLNADEQFEQGIQLLNKAYKAKENSLLDEMDALRKLVQKKQDEIHVINQSYSKLQFDYQSLNTTMKTIQDMNQDLQQERDKLATQVKLLTNELSKLKAFKKAIIQSINQDDLIDDITASQLMNNSKILLSTVPNSPPPNTLNLSGNNSYNTTPHYITNKTLDGKEFFKQAKEVLTNRQFNDFLQQIKLLNNQQQSPQQTLENVENILRGEHSQLIEGFKRILLQRQESIKM
ncbi:hypothetical protein ABK040_013614 [Willaertia magna]